METKARNAPFGSGQLTFRAPEIRLRGFQGLDKRKNRLPTGDVMVMLFVPLVVVMA